MIMMFGLKFPWFYTSNLSSLSLLLLLLNQVDLGYSRIRNRHQYKQTNWCSPRTGRCKWVCPEEDQIQGECPDSLHCCIYGNPDPESVIRLHISPPTTTENPLDDSDESDDFMTMHPIMEDDEAAVRTINKAPPHAVKTFRIKPRPPGNLITNSPSWAVRSDNEAAVPTRNEALVNATKHLYSITQAPPQNLITNSHVVAVHFDNKTAMPITTEAPPNASTPMSRFSVSVADQMIQPNPTQAPPNPPIVEESVVEINIDDWIIDMPQPTQAPPEIPVTPPETTPETPPETPGTTPEIPVTPPPKVEMPLCENNGGICQESCAGNRAIYGLCSGTLMCCPNDLTSLCYRNGGECQNDCTVSKQLRWWCPGSAYCCQRDRRKDCGNGGECVKNCLGAAQIPGQCPEFYECCRRHIIQESPVFCAYDKNGGECQRDCPRNRQLRFACPGSLFCCQRNNTMKLDPNVECEQNRGQCGLSCPIEDRVPGTCPYSLKCCNHVIGD